MLEFVRILSARQSSQPGMVTITYVGRMDGEEAEYQHNLDEVDQVGLSPTIREALAEWLADGGNIDPYEPPPPAPFEILFDVFVERMTDDEFESLDEAMQTEPLRLRRAWTNAGSFNSDSELWGRIMHHAVETFGQERADEITARP